jgi:carbon-monoxide dehydrogenase small subunit
MKKQLDLLVNGDHYHLLVDPHVSLLDVLRNNLGLTGTKEGCGDGECGACTVMVNGDPVNSCLMLAVQAQGKEITTIEGLAANGELDPVQKAFISHGAIQCGYCTPGMIMMAKSILDKNPDPSEEEIRSRLIGNLCRCTGYEKIVEAVRSLARSDEGRYEHE